MARKPSLSPTAIHVLALLPKEPIAWPIPDIAQDILGKADSHSLSRIKAALRETKEYLYIDSQNTRPYGRNKHYGVRADRWGDVQSLFQRIEIKQLLSSLPLKVF